jgi:hypothetical protein
MIVNGRAKFIDLGEIIHPGHILLPSEDDWSYLIPSLLRDPNPSLRSPSQDFMRGRFAGERVIINRTVHPV